MKKAREVAFLGIVTALSVVFLFIGSLPFLDVLDMTMAIVASLLLFIANEELKLKSIMVYFATSILIMVVMPLSLAGIEYIALALYPVLKPVFEKAPVVLAYILKAIYVLLSGTGIALIMYFLVDGLAAQPLMIALYVLLLILVLVLYDVLLKKFKLYYRYKLRHMLKLDKFFK